MNAPFDPLDPAMPIDPYPHYRALREADPVHCSPMGFWVLTRHADVAAMLGDSEAFQHCYAQTQVARLGPGVEAQPYFSRFRRMLFVMDGADHARVRRHVHGSIARRLSATRPKIATFAARLIDRASGGRRMDLIADYAYPLPKAVIGDMLGIPEADHERIADWAGALSPALEFLPMASDTLSAANAATLSLEDYFRELIARKRREPAEDHLSDLAAVIGATDGLSEAEAIANAILGYVAGHDTTTGAIGLAMLALHRQPSQWRSLVADPALSARAVDELTRFDTPGQGTARIAMRDATFGERTVPAESMILGYLGAANRDPAAFADPDRLDIDAGNRKPLVFGGGAHACVGQAIARYEIQVTLDLFARMCPGLELETLEPAFRGTALVRGVRALEVGW